MSWNKVHNSDRIKSSWKLSTYQLLTATVLENVTLWLQYGQNVVPMFYLTKINSKTTLICDSNYKLGKLWHLEINQTYPKLINLTLNNITRMTIMWQIVTITWPYRDHTLTNANTVTITWPKHNSNVTITL